MRKTYYYKNLTCDVNDETDVNFTVRFISNGNSGLTIINIPGPDDPEIENEGTVFIGKGKDLRNEQIICFSSFDNLIPEEDEVCIEYLINGQLIQTHKNLKEDEERPTIVLKIKFPAI